MNWNNDIQAATSEDAVIAIVNTFLFEQKPRFWSRVPEAAQLEAVDEARDIHRWHHDLVQALKAMKPPSSELQELCVLFLRASVRLHQIELANTDTGPSNDELDCAAVPRNPKRLC